jgi:AcrR family transcriptional regulator
MRGRDHVRQELLASAEKVLQQSGIAGVSVRRIAADADMSTMNIYSRFGSLSGLLDELVVDAFDDFEHALKSFAPTGDLISDIVTFASAYRTWVLDQPAKYRLMMTTSSGYEPGPIVTEARRHLLDLIADRVTEARAARTDAAPMTAEEAAGIVISMLHGTLMLELDGVVLELDGPREWAERFAVVIRFGLGRPASDAA